MEFRPLGDNAMVLCYGIIENEQKYQRVYRDYMAFREQMTEYLLDIVLCYSSIGFYFDPEVVSYSEIRDKAAGILEKTDQPVWNLKAEVKIPVIYGGKFGPDLEQVARQLQMSPEQVIREHTANVYTVFGIGFLPGFPYMGLLPESLVIPRKKTPASKVVAGSVAIAGKHTGIYPLESPGGWHVIGWTPVKMFDYHSQNPSLLRPGDTVRFIQSRDG